MDPLKKYKKTKYTKSQQESFLLNLENNPRYKNPFQALDYYTNKEGKKEYLGLQEHQVKFIKQFIYSQLRGAICFHGVGSGKTLTAVVCSYIYLKFFPKNKIIVISPSALLFNFINGMQQYGLDISDNRFSYYTYDKYIRNPQIAKNSLVIIDEAHNLRTEIIEKNVKDDKGNVIDKIPIQNVKASKIITNASQHCHKIICLTGTAFVNSTYDIENLLSMIDQRPPLSQKEYFQMLSLPDNIKDYFNYRISYYPSPKSEFFPENREQYIPLYMTPDQLEEYLTYKAEGPPKKKKEEESDNPNTFYAAERWASNMIKNNPKIKWTVDEIKKHPNKKFIVYSGLYDAGVEQIKKALTKEKIEYKVISGKETTTKKEESKKYYNGYNFGKKDFFDLKVVDKNLHSYINDKFRVLIISRAGAEGVDTINTFGIILLDQTWNEALASQIIARAIRFKSHFGLPKEERFVNVYRLFLLKQSSKSLMDDIIKNKDNDKAFLDINREISEENERRLKMEKIQDKKYLPTVKELKLLRYPPDYSKHNTKLNNALYIPEITTYKNQRGQIGKPSTKVQTSEDGWDQYKTLTDEIEKKNWRIKMIVKYTLMKEESSRSKEQADKEDLREDFSYTSDLNLFIKAKAKQANINSFIEKFGNDIQLYEQYQSKIINILDKEAKKKKRLLTQEEELEIYRENFKKEGNIILSTSFKKAIIQEREKKAQLQQYFTNPKLANYLIEYSEIEFNNNKLNLLEPTAGQGALLDAIIETNKDMSIDLVEIDEDNRDILKKYNNNFINLQNQGNFLKYMTSQRYDYIFMNPPFHLKRSENAILKRDVYDYDFVKRAFSFLKVGGTLCAIVSKKWSFFENGQHKEYFEKNASMNFSYEEKKQEKFDNVRIDVHLLKIEKLNNDLDEELMGYDYYNDNTQKMGKLIKENELTIDNTKFKDKIQDKLDDVKIDNTENIKNIKNLISNIKSVKIPKIKPDKRVEQLFNQISKFENSKSKSKIKQDIIKLINEIEMVKIPKQKTNQKLNNNIKEIINNITDLIKTK
jgi:predicted RNA methylase